MYVVRREYPGTEFGLIRHDLPTMPSARCGNNYGTPPGVLVSPLVVSPEAFQSNVGLTVLWRRAVYDEQTATKSQFAIERHVAASFELVISVLLAGNFS